jgi:sirohydrochlorin ferrochelatase
MRKYGVLVISHGSRDGDWVRLVDDAVAAVRVPDGIPIVSSFLEIVEGRLIQDGIDTLERMGVTDLIVVPLFVSSGSTHIDEISYALGVKNEPALPTELARFRRTAAVHMASPIDDDPLIADIVYAKLGELIRRPEREVLLLVGHGSDECGFRERWQLGLERLAARLGQLGGFAAAEAAMLLPDQTAHKLREWQERLPGYAVVVAPLFLSEGYFTRHVIPARLEGRHPHIRYNGKALLPSPTVSRWVERQVEQMLQRVEAEGQVNEADGEKSETHL